MKKAKMVIGALIYIAVIVLAGARFGIREACAVALGGMGLSLMYSGLFDEMDEMLDEAMDMLKSALKSMAEQNMRILEMMKELEEAGDE